jgi:hypothetical protein
VPGNVTRRAGETPYFQWGSGTASTAIDSPKNAGVGCRNVPGSADTQRRSGGPVAFTASNAYPGRTHYGCAPAVSRSLI